MSSLVALAALTPRGWAGTAVAGAESLADLSLEDLMNIEVVSVSRKEQRLVESPSAVFVLTQEDIRRSGATSLPEVLRMVPGVHVARVDGNKWSVSIRGFNSRFSDKLLVMIDGRSVYNPIFSGVYWEAQEMLLEDIERIEIVRGPGGTMWGSNAVNGVINVITKDTGSTTGGLVTVSSGNIDRGIVGLRFGQQVADGVSYRVFSRGVKRESQLLRDGSRATDDWSTLQGGFRLDWETGRDSSLMVTGNLYRSDANGLVLLPTLPAPTSTLDDISMSTGNLLGRWSKKHSERSTSTLQVYFDRYRRSELLARQRVNTVDIDFQQDRTLTERNRLLWGFGYRANADSIDSIGYVEFGPAQRTTHLANVFLQDEMSLVADKLILTFGAKFEHNSYTGWETQPSVSLLWNRTNRDNAWVSVARAVRIPSRFNRDLMANYQSFVDPRTGPALVRMFGTPDFRSEDLLAYEAGYRIRPTRNVSLDVAAFFNDYGNLAGAEPGQPFVESQGAAPLLVIPQYYANSLDGRSHGLETAVNWRPTEGWKLTASHSWMQMNLRLKPNSQAFESLSTTNRSPAHLYSLRSLWEPTRRLEVDLGYYYVGAPEGLPVGPQNRVDARLGWHVTDHLEISASVDNLMDDRHPETMPVAFDQGSEIARGGRLQATWTF